MPLSLVGHTDASRLKNHLNQNTHVTTTCESTRPSIHPSSSLRTQMLFSKIIFRNKLSVRKRTAEQSGPFLVPIRFVRGLQIHGKRTTWKNDSWIPQSILHQNKLTFSFSFLLVSGDATYCCSLLPTTNFPPSGTLLPVVPAPAAVTTGHTTWHA